PLAPGQTLSGLPSASGLSAARAGAFGLGLRRFLLRKGRPRPLAPLRGRRSTSSGREHRSALRLPERLRPRRIPYRVSPEQIHLGRFPRESRSGRSRLPERGFLHRGPLFFMFPPVGRAAPVGGILPVEARIVALSHSASAGRMAG